MASMNHTKEQLANLVDRLETENESLKAQVATAALAHHDDVPLHAVKLNAFDRPVGSDIWNTASLERGADLAEKAGGLVINVRRIDPIVPGRWIANLTTIARSMHDYTAENAMDGGIWGANNQIRRLQGPVWDNDRYTGSPIIHIQMSKIRAFLGRMDNPGDDDFERQEESLSKMLYFLEDLRQQCREFTLLRAAYKLAWSARFDGTIHQPREHRIAAKRQVDTEEASESAVVAQARALVGDAPVQVRRGTQGEYRPVNDGTLGPSPETNRREGVDGDADARHGRGQDDSSQEVVNL